MDFWRSLVFFIVALNDELCTSDNRVKEGSLVERRSAYLGGMCICFHYSQHSIVLCMLSVSFEKWNTQVINQAGFSTAGWWECRTLIHGFRVGLGSSFSKNNKSILLGIYFFSP